ncbi:MAG: hypothetical protein DSY85_16455 [Marinomonas sp.]|nr:MAG: hypothetical protein DSY85_16455 [Marinomonas sp.]
MTALWGILIVSFFSFMHFAVSVQKHHRDLYKKMAITNKEFRVLQGVAWVTLLGTLIPAIQHWGVGIGIMTWLLLITVSALVVTALVNFAPESFAKLWRLLGGVRFIAPPAERPQRTK